MNYERAMAEYNSRLKSRDYKVFYRYYALMLREDGVFEYCGTKWTKVNGKDTRVAAPDRLYATLDQNDVLTWMLDKNAEMGDRNLYQKMVGFGWATSDTTTYAMFENKVRFHYRHRTPEPIDVALVKGLAIDVKNRTVVAHTPDVKRSTNREASKPIIKYVQAVMKTMDVLHRLGALEETKSDNWYSRKAVLKTSGVIDMTEESMALLAQHAYTEAKAVSGGPTKYEYLPDKTQPINHYGTFPMKRIDHPEHAWKAAHYQALRNNAGKRLRSYLKEHHGGYDKEVITTTKGI